MLGRQEGQARRRHVVFWDVMQEDGVWSGGKGFKPSTGDNFKVKTVKASADGKHLEVTGCKLVFCRTGKWERVDWLIARSRCIGRRHRKPGASRAFSCPCDNRRPRSKHAP